MAVDIEVLVINPFRELVQAGKDALTIAEAAQQSDVDLSKRMTKAAQSTVKEGERALKRIQPLWDSHVERYGEQFKELMVENNEIAEKRRKLEELLYDFEDYIDEDSFDADRFTEVQAAARAFALYIIDLIKRLKIEAPRHASATTPTSPAPTHSFPPLPPLPRSRSRYESQSQFQSQPVTPTEPARPSSRPTVETGSKQRRVSPVPRSPDVVPSDDRFSRNGLPSLNAISRHSSRGILRNGTTSSHHSSVHSSEGPPLPTADTWSTKALNHSSNHFDRNAISGAQQSHNRRPSTPDILGAEESGLVRILTSPTSHTSPILAKDSWLAYDNSMHSGPTIHPESPATTANRTSVFSSTNSYVSSSDLLRDVPTSETRTSSLPAAEQEPTKPTNRLGTEYDDGLMLAEERTMPDAKAIQQQHPRAAHCSIGPQSSIHQLKGFCDGAQAYRKQRHQQGVKQAVAYGMRHTVGRCTHCEYFHLFNEVTLDVEQDARANFSKSGVLYRLRFLYKSHVPAQTTSETNYGCLFCIQTGYTIHQGDSTVFISQEQLFRHLAQHPQPLPELFGVTVLYGVLEKDHPQIEDYDLHFPSPPIPTSIPDSTVLDKLPIATALKNHVQRPGERKLADPDGNNDVLKFLAGARIVGVEFPEKWGGKWCTGWHDGVKGAFPVKIVQLGGPIRNEICLQSNSDVTVMTRWKWDPKDGERESWLSFDKGEVIRNVAWLTVDHWCWSGTNSKGKFGVFPRSHINAISVREGLNHTEVARRKVGSAPIRLFSRRKRLSSTASSMSGETG